MIEYIKILYEFDIVQSVFRKSRIQHDAELSNQFPAILRIEKNQVLQISCDLVLTQLCNNRWKLITGLTAIKSKEFFYVGNIVVSSPGENKKTAMVVINNKVINAKMNLYLFPDYDPKNLIERCRSANDFINTVCKNVGQI